MTFLSRRTIRELIRSTLKVLNYANTIVTLKPSSFPTEPKPSSKWASKMKHFKTAKKPSKTTKSTPSHTSEEPQYMKTKKSTTRQLMTTTRSKRLIPAIKISMPTSETPSKWPTSPNPKKIFTNSSELIKKPLISKSQKVLGNRQDKSTQISRMVVKRNSRK